jgi:hypothetical protein
MAAYQAGKIGLECVRARALVAKKSSRFTVILGLPPGEQRDWPNGFNFYFRVQDQTDPTQWALYLFGPVADTSIDVPLPQSWSVTDHVTHTPQPLSVAEWSGKGMYSETNQNYTIHSKMWIAPDVLNGRVFAVGLHISINKPQAGTSTDRMSSYPFQLRAVSPDVDQPGITSSMNRLRSMFIPQILLARQ